MHLNRRGRLRTLSRLAFLIFFLGMLGGLLNGWWGKCDEACRKGVLAEGKEKVKGGLRKVGEGLTQGLEDGVRGGYVGGGAVLGKLDETWDGLVDEVGDGWGVLKESAGQEWHAIGADTPAALPGVPTAAPGSPSPSPSPSAAEHTAQNNVDTHDHANVVTPSDANAADLLAMDTAQEAHIAASASTAAQQGVDQGTTIEIPGIGLVQVPPAQGGASSTVPALELGFGQNAGVQVGGNEEGQRQGDVPGQEKILGSMDMGFE
ncbi:hypothetical protein ACN47E_005473 [Coniothyrium glycines]